MKELKGKELLLVGFTLFSMFFGAGNLIFPPFTGAQAGTATWIAFAGLAVSAVGFPILGVVAVARSGGLDKLAGRVSPWFAAVFTFLIYLSIGRCLAIPRTASTSLEMAVTPFLGEWAPAGVLQLFYSLLFFAAALALALQPERLTDRLGKILCPILIALIVVLFVGCLVKPVGGYADPTGNYVSNQAVQGFLDGYQTMDTIAALNFGIIIALNIKARGVEREKSVVRGTIRAGWIAGAMLLVIYAMLAHIGAMAGGAFPGAANGAEILTKIVPAVFGPWGSAIVAAVFVIACFNTCVGLISCCSEYFCGLFPRFSYRCWAVFFAVVSMAVSNAGLNMILKVSVPVLNIIYPVAIVLILLSFCQRWLEGLRYVYPAAILFTGVTSIIYAVSSASLLPDGVAGLLSKAPLASMGLEWVLPAVLGAAVGIVLSLVTGGRRPQAE